MRIFPLRNFSLHAWTADPNAGVGNVGRIGDFGVRYDAGQVRLYQNIDGTATGWGQIAPPGGGTWTLTSALTITGAVITIGEGLLASLSTAVADYAVNTPTPIFVVRTEHPGGNVESGFTLPARTGGWKCIDAYTRSRGGTAGTLTLLDATGGNAMTDAIVPGNANVITRATSIVQAQEDVATGATPVWSGATNPPATDCYSTWVGL